jgi:hypothetical protein
MTLTPLNMAVNNLVLFTFGFPQNRDQAALAASLLLVTMNKNPPETASRVERISGYLNR